MHYQALIRHHISLIHEYRSQDPACTRDPRCARCTLTRTRRDRVRATGGPSDRGLERRGSERRDPSDGGPSDVHALGVRIGVHASGHAHANAPLPARRVLVRARRPAPPRCCRRRPVGERGLERRHSVEGQDDREEDEDQRTWAAKAEDRTAVDGTATVAMAAMTTDRTTAHSMARGRGDDRGDGGGHR